MTRLLLSRLNHLPKSLITKKINSPASFNNTRPLATSAATIQQPLNMSLPHALPATTRTLICEEKGKPLVLKTLPTPTATHGSAVIKVLHTSIDGLITKNLAGKSPLTFPPNMTPGGHSIGRVAAVGPDAAALKPGQLVLLEPFITARDDPEVQILWGTYDGPSPASKHFMADNWNTAAFAEYVRAPLENVHAVDEKRLCGPISEGGLGYSIAELNYLTFQVVAYAGLRSINLQAGERVVVTPATGGFSGAAVGVAVAMGARVVAAGRNTEVLKKMKEVYPGQVEYVTLSGTLEKDIESLKSFGPVDAYVDISPPQATGGMHVRSGLLSLRPYGRACLQGIIRDDIAIPYAAAVWKNLTIKGQYMYDKQMMKDVIKLGEAGILKLGKAGGQQVIAEVGLEDIEKGLQLADENKAYGQMVMLTP